MTRPPITQQSGVEAAVVPATPAIQPTAAVQPAAPTPAATPAVSVGGAASGGLTPSQIEVLRLQRSELSRQLESAVERRSELVRGLRVASETERPGLEARLKVLDERIVQIESDIATTGRALATLPRLTSSTSAPPPVFAGMPAGIAVPLGGAMIVFVLAPLAFAAARLMLKRAKGGTERDPEADRRLERLEQAVDAIAVEVERISEGQRFANRLLVEGQRPAEPFLQAARDGAVVRD